LQSKPSFRELSQKQKMKKEDTFFGHSDNLFGQGDASNNGPYATD